MITFAALHTAKRNRTLVAWLAAMTPAERVEAAEVCAANSARTASEWLRTFGELVDGASSAPCPACGCSYGTHEVLGREVCFVCGVEVVMAEQAALALEERAAQADAAAALAEERAEGGVALTVRDLPAGTVVNWCAMGPVVVSTPRWAVCDEGGNVVARLGLFGKPDVQVFTRKRDAEARRRELLARPDLYPLQCPWAAGMRAETRRAA